MPQSVGARESSRPIQRVRRSIADDRETVELLRAERAEARTVAGSTPLDHPSRRTSELFTELLAGYYIEDGVSLAEGDRPKRSAAVSDDGYFGDGQFWHGRGAAHRGVVRVRPGHCHLGFEQVFLHQVGEEGLVVAV